MAILRFCCKESSFRQEKNEYKSAFVILLLLSLPSSVTKSHF